MKKYLAPAIVICLAAILFANCHTTKKSTGSTTTTTTTTPSVTYAVNVKSVIETKCAPCHIPARGGNKKALDSYDNIKANITDAIRRISLNPTDPGFMPFRGTKLSDSTIAIFTQWRDAGMPE